MAASSWESTTASLHRMFAKINSRNHRRSFAVIFKDVVRVLGKMTG